MNNPIDELTFSEYRIALQLAKLSDEKINKILEKAALLKQIKTDSSQTDNTK